MDKMFAEMTVREILTAHAVDEKSEEIVEMAIATLERNNVPIDAPIADMTEAQTQKIASLNRAIETMISLLRQS